jgi:hypothetical protein
MHAQRLKRMLTFQWAVAAMSQTADTFLIATSKAAIGSSEALLAQTSLGTRLPGFEFS